MPGPHLLISILGEMTARWRVDDGWRGLADTQESVVSRRQLRGLGWTPDDVDTAVRGGRWRVLGGGVYVTHTGPLIPSARAWAVVLRCGPAAALASRSALAAWGVPLRDVDSRTHVAVPHSRFPRVPGTVCLHRRADHLARLHHPAAPLRQTVEAALVEAVAEDPRPEAVIEVVFATLGTRLTAPALLLAELESRVRLPGRPLLEALLADAHVGVASRLELEYLRNVHRRHRLPPAEFNAPARVRGRRIYQDVRYRGLVVELDGATYHAASQVADRSRDNAGVIAGDRTLRFGWTEIACTPCEVAATVDSALGPGSASPCGPACAVRRTP